MECGYQLSSWPARGVVWQPSTNSAHPHHTQHALNNAVVARGAHGELCPAPAAQLRVRVLGVEGRLCGQHCADVLADGGDSVL